MTQIGKRSFLKPVNKNGYTILELMVVISLIAILTAFVVPHFKTWLHNAQVKAGARDLYFALQKARVTAIKSGKNVSLNFTTGCDGVGGYIFTTSSGEAVVNATLTDGNCISFSTAPSGFDSRGFAWGSTGNVTITNPDSHSSYSITQSVAGNIRMKKI